MLARTDAEFVIVLQTTGPLYVETISRRSWTSREEGMIRRLTEYSLEDIDLCSVFQCPQQILSAACIH